jgi:peptidoglycan/LPS O-acetylase OafA/YrhL
VIAGVGLLYLLRKGGLLDAGPPVSDALPLERLARADAQPLLRVLAAWLPAGAAAAACLMGPARLRPPTSVLATGLLGLLLLAVAGASSEAVENSEKVAPHLLPQLGRPGLIVAVAALLAGALVAARVSARRPSR